MLPRRTPRHFGSYVHPTYSVRLDLINTCENLSRKVVFTFLLPSKNMQVIAVDFNSISGVVRLRKHYRSFAY